MTDRLQAHGFAAGAYALAIVETLRKIVAVSLDPGRPELRLARVLRPARLNELEFYFPLKRVTPGLLAEVFARYGQAEVARHFPRELERLTFNPLRGFMKGFIDLVFQFDGRFHLADWKTNWLGARVEDYHAETVRAEMRTHFYFLQYHFYTVALNEYLRRRVPGYEYERHFGGVFYLFLRGLDPARPELGVYRDRPDARLVVALSEALLERSGGGAP